MIISWLSIVGAVSAASALPVSVVPIKQYVLLAPELPKLELPSTVKLQQPVPTVSKPEPIANRQYVLMYPSYQFLSTRQQDAPPNFFEQVQNYFLLFGQNTQMMDTVEMDKPQSQAQPTQSINSIDSASEKDPNKQKLYYTFATPASTVPLNADQRLYYLAEQPQLFGAFSRSTVNPVFNLQPVVLSRSNVAQPDESIAQSSRVVSENVQKFSQIPPVMAAGVVPISSQVQGKSVVSEVGQNVDQNRQEHHDSVSVKHYDTSNVDPIEPVAESKVNPVPPTVAVEGNRAIPISTESSESAAVIETRSNPIPIAVSSEAVVAPVVSPPTDQQVEVKDVGVHSAEVGTVLKELHSVDQISHLESVVPAVQGVIDQQQHVQAEKVEQDAKHV